MLVSYTWIDCKSTFSVRISEQKINFLVHLTKLTKKGFNLDSTGFCSFSSGELLLMADDLKIAGYFVKSLKYVNLTDSSRGFSQNFYEIFAKYLRNICEIFTKFLRNFCEIRKNFAKIL